LLEYNTVIWSPYKVGDISSIEKVQRRFTKRLPGLKNLTYKQRLVATNLDTFELWRLRTDLVVCYKIVFGLIKVDVNKFFSFAPVSNTRSHRYKLLNNLLVMYDIIFSVDELSIYGIICRLLLTFPPWLHSNVVCYKLICQSTYCIVLISTVRLFYRIVVSALSSHSILACHVFCYIPGVKLSCMSVLNFH